MYKVYTGKAGLTQQWTFPGGWAFPTLHLKARQAVSIRELAKGREVDRVATVGRWFYMILPIETGVLSILAMIFQRLQAAYRAVAQF